MRVDWRNDPNAPGPAQVLDLDTGCCVSPCFWADEEAGAYEAILKDKHGHLQVDPQTRRVASEVRQGRIRICFLDPCPARSTSGHACNLVADHEGQHWQRAGDVRWTTDQDLVRRAGELEAEVARLRRLLPDCTPERDLPPGYTVTFDPAAASYEFTTPTGRGFSCCADVLASLHLRELLRVDEVIERVGELEAELDQTRRDCIASIDAAKKALGPFYITGRPLADCIRDLREAAEEERTAYRIPLTGPQMMAASDQPAQVTAHCWHPAGLTLTSFPPQDPEVCCWCGAGRTRTYRRDLVPGHGPWAPPAERVVPVISGGDGPCVPRPEVGR